MISILGSVVALCTCTAIAAARGLHPLPAFLLGTLLSFVVVLAAFGGFAGAEAFSLAVGLAAIYTIPAAVVIFLSTLLGWLFRRMRAARQQDR